MKSGQRDELIDCCRLGFGRRQILHGLVESSKCETGIPIKDTRSTTRTLLLIRVSFEQQTPIIRNHINFNTERLFPQ